MRADTIMQLPLTCAPAELELTRGQVAIIAADDLEWAEQWRWQAAKNKRTWYAVRSVQQRTIYLHRAIYERHFGAIPADKHIDHIDGDGLNNLPGNLRLASVAQNLRNARPRLGCTSQYKGVDWHPSSGLWRVRIHAAGAERLLGYFKCERTAADAYNEAARRLFGEFARLNVIREEAA